MAAQLTPLEKRLATIGADGGGEDGGEGGGEGGGGTGGAEGGWRVSVVHRQ